MHNDLKKYSYQHYENSFNIGWKRNGFGQKKVFDEEFLAKLKQHCDKPINVDYNGRYGEIEINGQKFVRGFGEIRILDLKNNKRYAAPNIIYDEITKGWYIPPETFVEAVKNAPLPEEECYKRYMTRYSKEYYWGECEKTVQKIDLLTSLLVADKQEFREHMQEKENLDLVTHQGSLLNYAIKEKQEAVANMLIEQGIDINAFEGVELLSAIENGCIEIADILIEKGIEMDNTELKVNPLVHAIRFRNNDIAKKLIRQNPELIVSYTNEFVKNFTILDVAKRFENHEIVNILR